MGIFSQLLRQQQLMRNRQLYGTACRGTSASSAPSKRDMQQLRQKQPMLPARLQPLTMAAAVT